MTAPADRPWWAHAEPRDDLLLRAIDRADELGVLAVHGDPRVYVFDPHETHVDRAHTHRFMTPMIEHWGRHGFGYWTVLVPGELWPEGVAGELPGDGDRVIAGLGGVQHHVVAGRPVLNVYFRLTPQVHGRGLAGAVVDTAIRLAPEVAPGCDLVVRTRPGNAAARRVATRAGFIDEGLEPGTTDMQLLRLPAPGLT